jgi:hypothetical protein
MKPTHRRSAAAAFGALLLAKRSLVADRARFADAIRVIDDATHAVVAAAPNLSTREVCEAVCDLNPQVLFDILNARAGVG